MPNVDFDFQRYVARRKGLREAQVREGAAYAFPGDVRVLRTLDKLRPVHLAVEETGRLWRNQARGALLGAAVRAGGEHFPAVQEAIARCARILHIEAPPVYIVPQPGPETLLGRGVLTLGTADEAYVVLSGALLTQLTPDELVFVLGREGGHIQNGHVPFITALYYLSVAAGGFVRWVVRPATLTLMAWARRALVSADRAGLLCARDLDVAQAALRKIAADEAGVGPRTRALMRFAGSSYYRSVAGLDQEGAEPSDACDIAVAQIFEEKDPA